ncbi:MAG: SMC-Scp complex subunit ScpB [Candidatus Latescibacter sp.]|nr:SMC-Scp complex subunit ScpB [Candidatus Latescibacter sp.]
MTNQLTRTRILEAVLFASDMPVEMERLSEILDGLTPSEIMYLIDSLNREYETEGRSFRLVEVAGGFQFETLPQFGSFIEKLYRSKSRPKLSRASLETLAIVAYKQPISKVEIDALRGVDSDAAIRTLQNRDLIEITGRSEAVGRPIIYGTTQEFLRYFGLKNIKDLPGADELASMFDGSEVRESPPEQLRLDEQINES